MSGTTPGCSLLRRAGLAIAVLVVAGLSAPATSISASRSTAAVPGELVVLYEPGATGAERAAARRDAGVRAVRDLGIAGAQLVETQAGATAEALAPLREDPNVRQVSRNWLRYPTAIPADPFFGQLWGLRNTGQPIGQTSPISGSPDADIDAPEAWELQPGWGPGSDTGTVVAVMDTGADLGHPDLNGRLWTNPGEVPGNALDDDGNGYVDDVHGYDFAGEDIDNPVDGDADPDDPDGHGTHVAGTVLAEGDNGEGVVGVAGGSQLMALKVCALDDDEAACSLAAMVEAYAYAAANGATVLNGSLGGPGFSALEVVLLSGNPQMLFVFAAGNGGEDGVGDDNDSEPSYPCALDEEPGYASDNLLCVTATTPSDGLAGFSNFGAESVDLAAPGVRILSTYPAMLTPSGFAPYAYMSGTSMAAPHVTGVAALLFAASPLLTSEQAKSALLESSERRASMVGKTVSGGRLNARLALEEIGVEPPSSPEEEGGDDHGSTVPPLIPVAPDVVTTNVSVPDQGQPEVRSAPVRLLRVFFVQRPGKVIHTRRQANTARAVFRFGSGGSGVAFLCRVDGGLWRRCPPRLDRRFAVGRHVLRVRAHDSAGNGSPDALTYSFEVRRRAG